MCAVSQRDVPILAFWVTAASTDISLIWPEVKHCGSIILNKQKQ